MTQEQYKVFSSCRNDFKKKINEWSVYNEELRRLQILAAKAENTPDYPVENPVCYNSSLDNISQNDEIKLILIGDNPGKNEQLEENKKYLVGLAGKLGEKFFSENPELKTDFRKNVIILNKTPVHSARTEQLRFIMKNGNTEISNLILESQKWMARATAELQINLLNVSEKTSGPDLWLIGYAELKNRGLFIPYRDTLLKTFKDAGKSVLFENNIFTYQHFSMNRFTIDLNNFIKENNISLGLSETLRQLGSLHRKEIFGV